MRAAERDPRLDEVAGARACGGSGRGRATPERAPLRGAHLARAAVLAVALLTVSGLLARVPAAAASHVAPLSSATTTVTVDGRRTGPAFQGIGAISGGGGNSRYLVDYPARERNAILGALFDPRRGAGLQLLKIEIGGDANSTDGAEPSVEQTPGHLSCGAGYELWLARQAVRRDPGIRLYGLQWSAPHWVRGPQGTLWTARDIRYLLDWLGCARRLGLHVSYLGGWNEHYQPNAPGIAAWYVELRRALDRHGYRSVTVVAADDYGTPRTPEWAVASEMLHDPAFGRAVGVIGIHDGCGAQSSGFACRGSSVARLLERRDHKLLWQSELGRTPNQGNHLGAAGPASLARVLTNAYRDAGFTASILWPLVDAMPPGLPFPHRGLVTADQPWSGHYRVSPLLYVVAHTTDFTRPGWLFVAGGNGRLRGGGSYVTYEEPGGRAWTMVVQTSLARGAQWLRVRVRDLPTAVHVWRSRLVGDGRIVEAPTPRRTRGGLVRVELDPGSLYTVTSLGHGPPLLHRPPPRHRFSLPYAIARDRAGMARYLAPMEGAFQYVGSTLTQVAVGTPVAWVSCGGAAPYAVVGTAAWRSYAVDGLVTLPRPTPADPRPGALLIAGFDGFHRPCQYVGYDFGVDATGRWRLVRDGPRRRLVAAGRVPAARSYRLRLVAGGRQLVGFVDGSEVVDVRTDRPVTGLAGLGTLGFDAVRFDRFSVTSTRPAPPSGAHQPSRATPSARSASAPRASESRGTRASRRASSARSAPRSCGGSPAPRGHATARTRGPRRAPPRAPSSHARSRRPRGRRRCPPGTA